MVPLSPERMPPREKTDRANGLLATVELSGKENRMGMEGHFGADITLDKQGKYEFAVEIEAGGKKASTKFAHDLK